MKAVVWTDVFQGLILFGGLLAVMIVVRFYHLSLKALKIYLFTYHFVFLFLFRRAPSSWVVWEMCSVLQKTRVGLGTASLSVLTQRFA